MGDFRKLKIWQEAKDIAVEIYKITGTEVFKKDFGLTDQLRRSAVSISSNIAEGDERLSNKESVRFFYISTGSIAELITQLVIAYEVGYITEKYYCDLVMKLENLSKQIKSIINYRLKNAQ